MMCKSNKLVGNLQQSRVVEFSEINVKMVIKSCFPSILILLLGESRAVWVKWRQFFHVSAGVLH